MKQNSHEMKTKTSKRYLVNTLTTSASSEQGIGGQEVISGSQPLV